MSKVKIIPYIWVKDEIKVEVTNDLDFLSLDLINEEYGGNFVKYQGGLIIKDYSNNCIFKTADMDYYLSAEAFIIRNYLKIKYLVDVSLQNISPHLPSGDMLYILKNEKSYYFKHITKNGKPLPPEIKYTIIDDEKLLSLKLSYIELIEALENSIEAIYNMYKTNYDVLKNNEVFLRYFKYIKNLSTKQNFDGSDDYW